MDNEITQIDIYWVDKYNNKWNKKIYSKEAALKASASLIDCID